MENKSSDNCFHSKYDKLTKQGQFFMKVYTLLNLGLTASSATAICTRCTAKFGA